MKDRGRSNIEQNIATLLRAGERCRSANMDLSMCIFEMAIAHYSGDDEKFEAQVEKAKSLSPLLLHLLEPVKTHRSHE